MQQSFFEFTLTTPISGNVTTLSLHAPCNIHRPLTAKLDSMLKSGMFKLAQYSSAQGNEEQAPAAPKDDKSSFMEAAQIMDMLPMIPSDDFSFYGDFCDTFKALMLSDGICKITDKRIGTGHYDSMSQNDGNRLMGEYIANFFPILISS